MDNSTLLEKLISVSTIEEKAAIVAESVLDSFPTIISTVAINCSFLNWFNKEVVSIFSNITTDYELDNIFNTIVELPFIERIPEGYSFHSVTRKGLVNKYANNQPDKIVGAYYIVLPFYVNNWYDDKCAISAIYGLIVTGTSKDINQRILELFRRFIDKGDINRLNGLVDVLDEIVALPIKTSIEKNELFWFTKAYANQVKGDYDDAINYYSKAIEINPKEAVYYNNRGSVYSMIDKTEEALVDFTLSLSLTKDDSLKARVFHNRGSIYAKLGNKEQASLDYDRALANVDSITDIATSEYFPIKYIETELEKQNSIKMLTVVIRSTGDKSRDVLRLRRLHSIIASYKGNDRVAYRVFEGNRGYLLEFPDLTIGITPELLLRLEQMLGKEQISVEEINNKW